MARLLASLQEVILFLSFQFLEMTPCTPFEEARQGSNAYKIQLAAHLEKSSSLEFSIIFRDKNLIIIFDLPLLRLSARSYGTQTAPRQGGHSI